MKKLLVIMSFLGLAACAPEKTETRVEGKDGESCVTVQTASGSEIQCGNGTTSSITNGTNGQDGVAGAKGDKGDKGETGAQGAKGDKGDKGDKGATGANGTNGTNGTNGINGLNLYFNSGVPSVTLGVNNEAYLDQTTYNLYKKINNVWVLQGNIRGFDGKNGLNFLSGSGAPTSVIGVDNELYYDALAFNVYKKVNGVWTLIGNLKGPKGDKGDKGDQGVQGIQGVAGLVGAKGDKGDKGDQGLQGIAGTNGTNGTNGLQGPKGDKGDKGDMGPQGPAGQNGTNGTNASNLIIYSNIPQNTCHLLTSGVYVYHSGSHIWFKKYSNCNHGVNEEGVFCARVAQYFDNGDSTVCWIGRKQYTVMGTGSSLKVYEVTHQ